MTPSCRVMNRHTAPGKQLPAASNDGDRNALEREFAELGELESERDSSLSRRADLHNDFERAAGSFAKARTEFERAGGDIYHRRTEAAGRSTAYRVIRDTFFKGLHNTDLSCKT
jgi:hypothetical protein